VAATVSLAGATSGGPVSEASGLSGDVTVGAASGMRSSPALIPLQPPANTAEAASTTDKVRTRKIKTIEGKTGNEERAQVNSRRVP
jgi:hypothetical protein